MATSTVSAVLKRIGLGKQALRLAPEEPIRHYKRRRTGELIHIDVKKLDRIGPTSRASACSGAAEPRRGTLTPMPRGHGDCKPAESEFTSASMTPPASPTSRSSPTRRTPPRSAS